MKKETANQRMVVDCAWHVSSQTHVLVSVDGEYYLIQSNGSSCKNCKKVVKQWAVAAIKNGNKLQDYEYVVYGLEKKDGYDVKIKREMTEEEFLELKERFGITEDQVSDPFETTVGDIYGDYRKTYMCKQIALKATQAIMLEEELTKKGIQASACAPGRLNIRIG